MIHKKILISHRSRDESIVENTFESFINALASKIDIIEIDIRFSKDNIPFLYHSFMTVDTDRKFIFAQKDARYIEERFYSKTGQGITSLEDVITYFLKNRRKHQKIALDIKDYGYEIFLIDFLEKYKLFDKVIIFTWTPQIVIKIHQILIKRKKKVPIFFSYLRSDAILTWLYKPIFGYVKNFFKHKLGFNVYYRYVFLNSMNYKKALGKYAIGYAHIYYSPKGLPRKITSILKELDGGICVNSRLINTELINAKKKGLKTAVFGGLYGILRIENVHRFNFLTHNKYVDYIFIDNIRDVFKNMFHKYHLIINAPHRWWLINIIKSNIFFYTTSGTIWRRKNFLSSEEHKKVSKILKSGDIVLLGQHRFLSGFLIRGVVTHSAVYYEHNLIVHSIADGVDTASLDDIFEVYDTMIILRAKKITKKKTEKIKEYLKTNLATPYDFSFNLDNNHFYCTELVHKAYQYAGVDQKKIIDNEKVIEVIEAKDFLKENYDIIFISKSLVKNSEGIFLNRSFYKSELLRKFLQK